MLPHDDLWLQLEAVEPWDRHDYGLWPGADRGAQEGPEHRRGKRRYNVLSREYEHEAHGLQRSS